MYLALYRKYRPSTFSEVIGQKIVVKTLSNAIINKIINHAYLFCGPRGTGKTSIAKIFAKTVNCSNLNNLSPCNKCESCLQIANNQSIDIIEIDAASNNGVDEIRELRNNVNLVPSTGNYKVYIIDEVHMLTQSAFNALLKTLEEPPKHVIFILATTEVHKIPQTVLSRCQRFDFKKLTVNQIKEHLSNICQKEKIQIDDNSLKKIAAISNGGMRDALSLLDQINAYTAGLITENDVDEICGYISDEQTFEIISNISDFVKLLELIKKIDNDGKNLNLVLDSIVDYLKNVLIYTNDSNYFNDSNIIKKYDQILSVINEKQIYDIIDIIIDTTKNMKYDNNKLLSVELCFIKINSILKQKQINQLNNDIKNVEQKEIQSAAKLVNDDNKNLKGNKIANDYISKLKEIRINNTLSMFNKKDMISFKNNLKQLDDYVADQKYSSLVSLISDGELKAKGKNYILFVYKNNSLEKLFNDNIEEIEEMFNNIYKEKYKVIAENINNWDKIKVEFNKALRENRKIYQFIEEKEVQIKEKNNKSTEIIEKEKTPIDNMFKEIVQYN